MTSIDVDEFNPFRGNVFQTLETDEEGNVAEKDSLGRLRYRDVTEEEAINRWNYKKSYYKNYKDGDYESSVIDGSVWTTDSKNQADNSDRMYANSGTAASSLVTDKSRVYKGGSWRDRAYWLSPGTRRFLDEEQSRDDLGFRCAMVRVGGQSSGVKTKK
jgi:formylglycine-generating enzyme required for sulfatase activity